jgi:hypothetical protein
VKTITLEVDETQFYKAATEVDRDTLASRFAELVLSTETLEVQIGLLAIYGIMIKDVQDGHPASR